MITKVFRDFDSFKKRKDKKINGVSKEFANMHPDYVKQNETNAGCWNCTLCKDCTDCENCYQLDECIKCICCKYGKKQTNGVKLTAWNGTENEGKDDINKPSHYGGDLKDNPYETIKIIEHLGLGFHLGNVVKYITRAGKKGDRLTDLKKARWYLDREINKK